MKEKRKRYKESGKGAIEIIEEAIHLVRQSPLEITALYYVGSLPFILGVLYFLGDMSSSAVANDYCMQASFGLTLLFIWMKSWQAVYLKRLRALVYLHKMPTLTIPSLITIVSIQTIVQSTGLFLLPLSFLIALPFGWVYAFYQNILIFGDGNTKDILKAIKKSIEQTALWPGQNHLFLTFLSGIWFFLFLNLLITVYALPHLITILFAIETQFSISNWNFLNTTFLATVFALSFLIVDPLIKAFYLLRCFYGETVNTGEDLKIQLI